VCPSPVIRTRLWDSASSIPILPCQLLWVIQSARKPTVLLRSLNTTQPDSVISNWSLLKSLASVYSKTSLALLVLPLLPPPSPLQLELTLGKRLPPTFKPTCSDPGHHDPPPQLVNARMEPQPALGWKHQQRLVLWVILFL
jgi:hypothetical protein